MMRLRKDRENYSSKSFVMHGFREGPISQSNRSLTDLPSSKWSSTLNTTDRVYRPEPRSLQRTSAQRPRDSIPVPVHSRREEAGMESCVSSSWSEEDDIRFSSNLAHIQAADSYQAYGPGDQIHAAESAQAYGPVDQRQTYKAYKPASIQKQGHLTRHAQNFGSKPITYPGFPTLAGSYQHLIHTDSVATGSSEQIQPARQAFPNILRAGRIAHDVPGIPADEEHPQPVLQGSACLF